MWNENGYLDLCRNILETGAYRQPEGEEGRYELFAQPLKFDLRDRTLPLLTTKKMQWKSLATEMLWFISGETTTQPLKDNGVGIWDTWSGENGEVGPLYGYMWRHWWVDPNLTELNEGRTEIDQLQQVIKGLRERPEARSHMITAWRPDWLNAMSIKPCHILLQFYRIEDEVHLAVYQRSCDMFLGVPFNIAQYSLLTHLVSHHIGCEAGTFTWIGGDTHIYETHIDQVREQLTRTPLRPPKLIIHNHKPVINGYTMDDFSVDDYHRHDAIKAPISPQGQPGRGTRIQGLRKVDKV